MPKLSYSAQSHPNCYMRFLLAVVMPLSLFTFQAKPPAGHAITAADILNSYVQATGGLDRRKKLSTLEIQGSLNLVPRLSPLGDDFYYWQKSPDNDLFKLDLRSHGSSWIGHQHGQPVSRHNVEGAGMMNDVSIFVMEHSLYVLTEWDWADQYTKIELLGAAMVDGKRAFAIGFTPVKGNREIRYFDPQTFLLIRIDQAQRVRSSKGEEAAYEIETYFSDYKEIDGLLLPRTVTFRCSACGIQLNLERITTNAPVEDATFVLKK